MEARIKNPLDALEASLVGLLTSLTTTNTFTAAPAATRNLISADSDLSSALQQLKQHQNNYKRIVELRSEADRLQESLRDVVRTCSKLREEIGNIHPSILEDEDDEEDEDEHDHKKVKDVDYETLLGFAARIGRHNAAAAREAEQESSRRRVEASQKKSSQTNGDALVIDSQSQTQGQNTTQESQNNIAMINDAMASQRARIAMAFPPPESLREGMLGQLQLLREQQGELAVEREVERLVRESENIASTESKKEAVEESTTNPNVSSSQKDLTPEAAGTKITTTTTTTTKHVPNDVAATRPRPPPQPQQKAKPVSLDFDDDSDDDDD